MAAKQIASLRFQVTLCFCTRQETQAARHSLASNCWQFLALLVAFYDGASFLYLRPFCSSSLGSVAFSTLGRFLFLLFNQPTTGWRALPHPVKDGPCNHQLLEALAAGESQGVRAQSSELEFCNLQRKVLNILVKFAPALPLTGLNVVTEKLRGRNAGAKCHMSRARIGSMPSLQRRAPCSICP